MLGKARLEEMKMIIKQTNLNLVYPRIMGYRKKFANSEEVLQRYFLPSTILPIPDQVQNEVPRIIAQTKNGHSVLNIALTVSSFTTNYNGSFVSDWNKCKDYLAQRCSDIYSIIDNMTENNNTFVGLITNVEIDDLDGTGLEVLKKSLFGEKVIKMGELYDLSCKLTYIYKKQYYINITLQNLREFSAQQYSNGRTCITGERKHTVSASIDINDRYAANNNINYKSKKEAFDEILNITSNIIDNKLENLVRKGEFVYDE